MCAELARSIACNVACLFITATVRTSSRCCKGRVPGCSGCVALLLRSAFASCRYSTFLINFQQLGSSADSHLLEAVDSCS